MDRRGTVRMAISVQRIGTRRTRDGGGGGVVAAAAAEVAQEVDLELTSESCAISLQTEGERVSNSESARETDSRRYAVDAGTGISVTFRTSYDFHVGWSI